MRDLLTVMDSANSDLRFPKEYYGCPPSTVAMGRFFEQITQALFGGWHRDDRLRNGIPAGEHGDTPDITNFETDTAYESKAMRLHGSFNILDTQLARYESFQQTHPSFDCYQIFFAHDASGIHHHSSVAALYRDLASSFQHVMVLPLEAVVALHRDGWNNDSPRTRRYEEDIHSHRRRPFPSCTVVQKSTTARLFEHPVEVLHTIGYYHPVSYRYERTPPLKMSLRGGPISIPSVPLLTVKNV